MFSGRRGAARRKAVPFQKSGCRNQCLARQVPADETFDIRELQVFSKFVNIEHAQAKIVGALDPNRATVGCSIVEFEANSQTDAQQSMQMGF